MVQAFFNFDSKLNIMSLIFAKKLGFWIWKTKINIQKIYSSSFETFGIVIIFFLLDDKADRPQFFEKTFLIVNINIDITLEILFLILNNVKIDFLE